MNDDAALLCRYADEGSQEAFAELVRRHIDLVYRTALRRTRGDPHRAADVAQQVFIKLARAARNLSRHPVLAAWLHTATRNAALNLMISDQRRRVRESRALDLAPDSGGAGAEPDWERLRPVLDEAIDELPEADRAVVVLRYLEQRAFAEIGSALRISEDAARMRTDRALDKLRTGLARRGISSTAAALGAAVMSQPMLSAPAGLAAAVSTQALAVGGAGAGAAGALATFMNIKTVTTAAVSALVFFGVGTYVGLKRVPAAPPPPPAEIPRESPVIATLRQENDSLRADLNRLKTDIEQLDTLNDQLKAQIASQAAAPRPRSPTLGMSIGQQQRAMLNNLRQIAAARDQFALEHGRPAASVHDLVGVRSFIKTVRTVAGEDYSEVSMVPGQPLTVTTPDGTTATYDPTGGSTTVPQLSPEEKHAEELGRKIEPAIMKAMAAYRAANNGNNPPNEQALIPFLATPQEAADFADFIKARRAAGM